MRNINYKEKKRFIDLEFEILFEKNQLKANELKKEANKIILELRKTTPEFKNQELFTIN
ncbi:MAG TPA: hypothetical protein VGB37_15445 [Candidatus Lokiarchaeia archaeon]